MAPVKENVPAEWRRVWSPGQSGIHPTFPLDGRETIYDPYEEHAPTTTVKDYLLAALRAQRRDPDLPPDFNDYLTQRVPSTVHFGSVRTPLLREIDRTGKVV